MFSLGGCQNIIVPGQNFPRSSLSIFVPVMVDYVNTIFNVNVRERQDRINVHAPYMFLIMCTLFVIYVSSIS